MIKIILLLTLITSPAFSTTVEDWKRGVSRVESKSNYQAVNPHTNALGRYQFVPRWWWTAIVKFANDSGVKLETYADFLNNPPLQESFMSYVFNDIYKPQAIAILEDYPDGKLSLFEVAALIHFKGYADARRWIEKGEDKTTKNNISIHKYLEVFNNVK